MCFSVATAAYIKQRYAHTHTLACELAFFFSSSFHDKVQRHFRCVLFFFFFCFSLQSFSLCSACHHFVLLSLLVNYLLEIYSNAPFPAGFLFFFLTNKQPNFYFCCYFVFSPSSWRWFVKTRKKVFFSDHSFIDDDPHEKIPCEW